MLTLQGTESRYAQRRESATRMDKEDSLILMQQSLPLWKHAWMWCVGGSIFSCTIESERKTKINENTKRRFHVIESGEHGHAEWLEQLILTMLSQKKQYQEVRFMSWIFWIYTPAKDRFQAQNRNDCSVKCRAGVRVNFWTFGLFVYTRTKTQNSFKNVIVPGREEQGNLNKTCEPNRSKFYRFQRHKIIFFLWRRVRTFGQNRETEFKKLHKW